jgi:hypothetical protein
VIVEILLNLIASYLFAVLGLLLLMDIGAQGHEFRGLIYALIATLPVPIVVTLLLRHGSVFDRLQRFLRPMVGATALSNGAAALDREVRATLDRRATLVLAGGLQLLALISGAFEVWFALRLVRTSGRHQGRDHLGKHDAGGQAGRVRRAGGCRRTGGRTDPVRCARWVSAANSHSRSRWPSVCAKCSGASHRSRPGNGSKGGACGSLHAIPDAAPR